MQTRKKPSASPRSRWNGASRLHRPGRGVSPRTALGLRPGLAESSLDSNRRNLDALQLQVVIHRQQGDRDGAAAALTALLALDPLNHCARFEKWLNGQASLEEFKGLIRNELPHETYLELTAWYHRLGLDEDAARLLAARSADPCVSLLAGVPAPRRPAPGPGRRGRARVRLPLPLRVDTRVQVGLRPQPGVAAPVLPGLDPLVSGRTRQARELLAACGNEPRFGPFYAARAQVDSENATRDLKRAIELDPGQWRYDDAGAGPDACGPSGGGPGDGGRLCAAVPRQYRTGRAAREGALVLNGRYQEAAGLLSSLDLLPSEGVTDARTLFHEAYLMLAVERIRAKAYGQALPLIETARQWPEHLGSGKPYPEDVDERLEDWLVYQCQIGLGAPDAARRQRSTRSSPSSPAGT